jgi:hypothetical protein
MINDRANYEGSEIWDAQIRGIVQLHKEQPSCDGASTSAGLKAKATGGESTLDLEKKVYYPISLSPDSHPHFSRIWYARHVLNAESPLLKREIRDMIVKDGGKWDKGACGPDVTAPPAVGVAVASGAQDVLTDHCPLFVLADFNTWEEIRYVGRGMTSRHRPAASIGGIQRPHPSCVSRAHRDCLSEFISLRITLSGTSAVSASTVYGEHVYEFDDVCVGWR